MNESDRFRINEIISLYYDGKLSADRMAVMIAHIVNFTEIQENKRK